MGNTPLLWTLNNCGLNRTVDATLSDDYDAVPGNGVILRAKQTCHSVIGETHATSLENR